MNEFRMQLNEERASYVTREQLDLHLDNFKKDICNIKDKITVIENKLSYNKGRDYTLYIVISMAVSLLALLLNFIK